MPVPMDSSVAMTRPERALSLALQRCAQEAGADLAALWQAWASDGGMPLASAADMRAQCADAATTLRFANRIQAILRGETGRQLARQLSASARALVVTLMISAVERYLAQTLVSGDSGAQQGDATVHAGQRVTAEMMAALRHDCGMLWEHRAEAQSFVVDNARWDHPSHEFGSTDAAFEAWMTELMHWCDRRRDGRSLLERELDPGRSPCDAVLDPVLVRDDLDRVARDHGVLPVILAHAAGQGAIRRDPGLRARLSTELGVPSVLVDLDDGRLDQNIRRAESTVRQLMGRLVAALYGEAAAPGAAAGAVQRRPGREVFVSYAHQDGAGWLALLNDQLASLPGDCQVHVWSDEQLATGDDWNPEIRAALARCACAVLVVTPRFLASQFIREQELPLLLERARNESGGFRLFPVQAIACTWALHQKLNWLQLKCKGRPLQELQTQGTHSQALAELAVEIAQWLGRP